MVFHATMPHFETEHSTPSSLTTESQRCTPLRRARTRRPGFKCRFVRTPPARRARWASARPDCHKRDQRHDAPRCQSVYPPAAPPGDAKQPRSTYRTFLTAEECPSCAILAAIRPCAMSFGIPRTTPSAAEFASNCPAWAYLAATMCLRASISSSPKISSISKRINSRLSIFTRPLR
jgi:hypothetical protein